MDLEQRVQNIEERNRRVEADKAWELSRARTFFIAFSTYVLILIFMFLIKDAHPFLNALVASFAYLISSESYGIIKKWWLSRNAK